jgi:hypothetical protein
MRPQANVNPDGGVGDRLRLIWEISKERGADKWIKNPQKAYLRLFVGGIETVQL